MEPQETSMNGLEIAVIGMAGRFPGAPDVHHFWENLKNGIESISFFSDEELNTAGVEPRLLEKSNYVKAYGNLRNEDVEFFDSFFFGYLPREAETLNPQVRIFLECSREALENAGYEPELYKGLIGIYAGASNSFTWEAKAHISGDEKLFDGFTLFLLTDKDFLSTRISYKLNLKGPALNVQTACSTSLVAIHQASRAILTGECDMALAGGVTIFIPQESGYLYQPDMIKSQDGHCRAFDARAAGVNGGSGIGVVVLKRLDTAIADGDEIYALIKGSAINNDGNRKVGYTAPSVEGQAEVIKAAHQAAEVEPESIGYIETHGTATNLGDPVEIEALKLAFNSRKSGFCALGSVKTNVGHLDSAAGVAGFIKTVLALKHRLIPPSLHFETPNPRIDFGNSPFYVNTRLREWNNEVFPLRAGVSSFGIGGTNAHVVLEEAPKPGPSSGSRSHRLFLFSAVTGTALERIQKNLGTYLRENPGINLADAAYTLQVGRGSFAHRAMLVSSGNRGEEVIEALLSPDSGRIRTALNKGENRPVVFMFPGQGSQYVNMGLELYREEAVFRQEMDRCFEILKPLMEHDLKGVIYPSYRSNGSYRSYISINRTEITQPLMFVFEYALARLLMKWGIRPNAMVGHSIGEYVAACLSGVFSLSDALTMVTTRGRSMQQMPEGSMIGVTIPEEELKLLLPGELSLAAVNGPSHCVVSGPREAVHSFAAALQEKGYNIRQLHTSHAFHSRMMDPMLPEFAEKISKITLNKPGIPYISNVTGKWITVEDAKNPQYWVRQLRETVRFSAGLEVLLAEAGAIFLEVGPGTTLSTFTRQYLDKHPGHPVLNLVRHPRENIPDIHCLLNGLGQLWLYGKTIDWQEFYSAEKRKRVPLPTYPYDHRRYPVDFKSLKSRIRNISRRTLPGQGEETDITQWFYIPLWMKSPLPDPMPVKSQSTFNWLVFIDGEEWESKLVKRLEEEGQKVCKVKEGVEFKQYSEHDYSINPHREKDYHSLMEELEKSARLPHRILHLWGVSPQTGWTFSREKTEEVLERGFYSLLHIAQALGRKVITHDIKLGVVTANMQEVTGAETLFPEKAIILGAVNVIPLEYPHLDCRSIDIEIPEPGSPSEERLIERLLAELPGGESRPVIAYRGHHRWERIFKPQPIEPSHEVPQRLKEKGVYLISGGLGGIGLTLAGNLARKVKARLILTGRTVFPPVGQWDDWLKNHEETDSIGIKIKKVRELEALGAEVLVISANVSDLGKMQEEVANAEKRFGPVNGIIHAAGIPDGAIIQGRTRRMSEQVFESKIGGTLVLEQIFKGKKLDFFVLCSSLNSIIPALGQAAYSAANAYLDAFAIYRNSLPGSGFTTAINWDAWQEVGMAVEAAKKLEKPGKAMQTKEVHHPLFNKYTTNDSFDIYTGHFSVKKNWVLAEHRVMGKATLPGTVYVEMARAAFAHAIQKLAKKTILSMEPDVPGEITGNPGAPISTPKDGPKDLLGLGLPAPFENSREGEVMVEIRDLYFLKPLVVEEEEEIEVRTLLKKQEQEGKGYEFSIISRPQGGKDEWQEHAGGYIRPIREELPPQYEIGAIESICNLHPRDTETREKDPKESENLLKFGPRWNCVRQTKLGVDQGLKRLELPGDFNNDLELYTVHPALLDCALAGVFSRGSYFLPFSYKSIKIYGALPARIASYIRFLDKEKTREEFKNYQVAIMDETGKALIFIEQYTLKKVSPERIKNRDIVTNPPPQAFINKNISPGFSLPGDGPKTPPGRVFFDQGLLPSQGVEVFDRILASSQANVVISVVEFEERLKKVRKRNLLEGVDLSDRRELPESKRYARPELSTPYIRPADETEKKISGVFQKLLGIEQIGVNDNFFELGANSLLMVQVNRELQKELKKDISIANIYAYPTVKLLGGLLSKEGAAVEGEGLSREEIAHLHEKTEKGIDKLKQRKERRKGMTNE